MIPGDGERHGDGVAALVRAALNPSDEGGLTSLLHEVATSLDASGCILWELDSRSIHEVEAPEGRLFVSASYFPTQARCAIHDLPLRDSPTGQAIADGRTIIVNDFKAGGGAEKGCPFLMDIGAMVVIPLAFQDGNRAALSVYRKPPGTFTDREGARLSEWSDLLPLLYQAIRDRINSRLVGSVNQILEQSEANSRGKLVSLEEKRKIFKRICVKIAETLHCREASLFLYRCREVSLFLNEESKETMAFELMATTLPGRLGKTSYSKGENDGLTGWVLDHAEPAWIFALDSYHDDRDWFERIYPGLPWEQGVSMREFISKRTGLAEDELTSPISVLAVPVIIGDKVIGVIRCSIAENPYYFSPRDLELLKLVVAQIAQCWSTWLGRREMKDENETWERLIKSINEFNNVAQEMVESGRSDESWIWDEALKQVERIIPDTELNSIRLVDRDAKEIRFAAIRGKSLDERKRGIANDYRQPLEGDTVAAKVIESGKQQLITELSEDSPPKRIFPETKRSIITPIEDRREILGVLELRSEAEAPFPKHAETVAELLGGQLGLYHRLAATIGQLRREKEQQIQTSADISHQLKGPINQAKARVDRSIEDPGNEPAHLRAVRGLCRKAQRVVGSLGLLSDLESQKSIQLKRAFLDQGTLVKMLIEASQDTEFLIGTRRNIRIHVNRVSFDVPQLSRVEVDHGLLEQAINNLFDNAGKYSFKDTRVVVYGGLTNSRRFHITVRNTGLKIRPAEIKKCVSREWRSEEAMMTTEEGSGIGLWIVSHIMAAHRGELIIVPTTADNITEVKLIFPILGQGQG